MDGTEVKILERRSHFALGYWIDGFGCAHPAKWDDQGLPKETTGADSESEHDLRLDFHDWKDEIPWGWIQGEWITRNNRGLWVAWQGAGKPYPNKTTGIWKEDCGSLALTIGPAIKMPKGPDKWTEAIAKRPEGR
jgi:hypothetical protein